MLYQLQYFYLNFNFNMFLNKLCFLIAIIFFPFSSIFSSKRRKTIIDSGSKRVKSESNLSKTCNQKFRDKLEYDIGKIFLVAAIYTSVYHFYFWTGFFWVAVINTFLCYFNPWKSRRYKNHDFWINGFAILFKYNCLIGCSIGVLFYLINFFYSNEKYKLSYVFFQLMLNILLIVIADLLTYCSFSDEERCKREEDKKKILNQGWWDKLGKLELETVSFNFYIVNLTFKVKSEYN